ncbi:trifunctional nucleotide phosphoesterase protein YfkN [Roseovarius mucosus]|uniref:Trifunctional nucleotide phosphoesterase protein YfkN n=1 Tax=Roseovarius mucosus TaxID=215743 RepID=A0A1V0RJE5_9RHOB|nr:choice-of-anchor I family protein [Roseovarius mucosus]ARE81890.1 trifunctional nucleotide phosphoesterase protein YfkN [Roseovarius mucosus]
MAYTLQLLHANDLEGGVAALDNAPNFAAIVDTLEDTFENTILLSAGDNYIPGPFFSTAADFSMGATLTAAYERFYTEVLGLDLTGVTLDIDEGPGRVDITIMNVLGFDASAVGNHEFDPGTNAFAGIINASGGNGEINWVGALFPYLSANIDFSGDNSLGRLFTDEILTSDIFAESLADLAARNIGPAIAPATLIEEGGELIGVVGATTQIIETISSTGGTNEITGGANNMAALAAVIQPQIDALIAAGANKIILTSHLQQISLEKELAGLLDGVDIIIAGGSNTLQADANDRLRDGDAAAEAYPFLTVDTNGNPVAIVSTDGEYSYLGRLVVEFDDNGVLVADSINTAVSGTFATDAQGVLDVTGAATLTEALDASAKASIVQDLTDAVQVIVDEADAIAFGNHDVFLDGRRETVRTEESNLGNLTADANLSAARGADTTVNVSFKNGGGIRAEIGSATNTGTDAGDGVLSQLDLQNSLRFNNGLAVATVTKEGFLMLLEHGVADTDTDAGNTPGRFFQIGGFRVSFDEAGTAQQLVTDANGDYVVDPATDRPQVAVAGDRIKTVALIDPETGDDIVIFRDGAFTAEAPETIRMVTLDFLMQSNGDGYPFQELISDVQFLTPEGGITSDTEADRLGEQQALGDFMSENFPDEDTAFANAETDVANDLRIVQLARNGGIDRILLDENTPTLEVSIAANLLSGETELFTGGSEVVSVDAGRAYVTNGAQNRVDVFDAATGEKLFEFDLGQVQGFDGVQSVAAKNGLVAAAISVTPAEANGVVAIFDLEGTLLNTIEVGNLPDMLTFSPDGTRILVANEGEPLDGTDPLGSVSIIDLSGGAANATAVTLDFSAFDGQEDALREAGVLIQPGNSASQDLEPEYITVLPDGVTAWVSLQEANAYAVIDLTTNTVTDIRSFGLVDRSLPGNEIDASNRDNAINLQTYDNLFGMRQPDAITSIEIGGETYIFTANEGDARDATEARIGSLDLDPTAFPNADILQLNENLGRLNVRTDLGDTDGDGDYDQLFHYGARSFTIYNAAGEIVFDSGSQFSQLIAEIRPELFNQDEGEFDNRSDDKGVEPEAIAVGVVEGKPYVFIGLERDSGIMVFDISDPANPVFDSYIDSEANGNISPETIAFIPAEQSATGFAQIAIAYEGDGNTAIYNLDNLGVDSSPTGRSDGDDTLVGTDGDDGFGAGAGDDLVNGGAGNDNLGGGFGNDTVNGGAGNDTIGAGLGDDIVNGGAGNDVANGGAGNDLVRGEDGNDRLGGGQGADTVEGGTGDDFIGGGAGTDLLDGGEGNDSLGGGLGDDTVLGGAGDDFVAGGGRDDVLDGGAGNDTLNGGSGNDLMTGGEGVDTFVFNTLTSGEADIITDFDASTETVILRSVASFDTLDITDTVAGAVVAVDGQTITFEAVLAADLTADNFLFG